MIIMVDNLKDTPIRTFTGLKAFAAGTPAKALYFF